MKVNGINMQKSAREADYVLDLARLEFYKKHFGPVVWAVLIEAIVIGVMVVAFVILKSQQVEREYFGVDGKTGRMIPMVPMSDPYISRSALLTWAQTCVTDANTYDFVNYRKEFEQSSQCFTDEGWNQFSAAVEKAGTLQTVKDERLVASAVAAGAGVVTREGIRGGIYTWEMQLPVTISYQGGSSTTTAITQKLLVTLLVTRVPTDQKVEGVGIAQYIGAERS
jgi:intracellular multiplication protein IcmL